MICHDCTISSTQPHVAWSSPGDRSHWASQIPLPFHLKSCGCLLCLGRTWPRPSLANRLEDITDNKAKQDKPRLDAVKPDQYPDVQTPRHQQACYAHANDYHVLPAITTCRLIIGRRQRDKAHRRNEECEAVRACDELRFS